MGGVCGSGEQAAETGGMRRDGRSSTSTVDLAREKDVESSSDSVGYDPIDAQKKKDKKGNSKSKKKKDKKSSSTGRDAKKSGDTGTSNEMSHETGNESKDALKEKKETNVKNEYEPLIQNDSKMEEEKEDKIQKQYETIDETINENTNQLASDGVSPTVSATVSGTVSGTRPMDDEKEVQQRTTGVSSPKVENGGKGKIDVKKTRTVIGQMPDKIEKPIETDDVASIGTKGFEDDKVVMKSLLTQFESEYKALKIEKNIFNRYVIGYRHIKEIDERIKVTKEHLTTYFTIHRELDFDNLIYDKERGESTLIEKEGWPVYIYGQDKQGHIIMWDEIGSVDVNKLDLAFLGKDFSSLQLHRARVMRRVENLKAQMQKKYKYGALYKHIMIFDMKHFSLSKHGAKERRNICKKVIEEMTNMYPETVFRIYVLNAPGAFRAFFQVLKLFMDPITADKTRVLGKNYLKDLIKDIDINMIPPKHGGKGVWNIRYSTTPQDYPFDCFEGL